VATRVANGEEVKQNGANLGFVAVLGDDTLRDIARALVFSVKRNATIDWTLKESVRAKLRVAVRRVLRKYGYPPDKQDKTIKTVLEQVDLLADLWAA